LSIVQHKETVGVNSSKQVEAVLLRASTNDRGEIQEETSPYNPDEETLNVRAMILRHFILGTVNMYTPRVEFNDLSLVVLCSIM